MQGANSPNHLQEGQNVLYGEGHVDWQPSPFCGSTEGTGTNTWGDNIYAARPTPLQFSSKGKSGMSIDQFDSVMYPSFVKP